MVKIAEFIDKAMRETAEIFKGNFEMKLTIHVQNAFEPPFATPVIVICPQSCAEGIIELDMKVKA